jgi:hypothetical protein
MSACSVPHQSAFRVVNPSHATRKFRGNHANAAPTPMPIVALAILAACLLLRTSAHASVSGGGLKIRWFGEKPQAAQAGQEFVGHVEIIAAKPGSLDSSRSWDRAGRSGARMPGPTPRWPRRAARPQFPGGPERSHPTSHRAGHLQRRPRGAERPLRRATRSRNGSFSTRTSQGPKLSGVRPKLALDRPSVPKTRTSRSWAISSTHAHRRDRARGGSHPDQGLGPGRGLR